MRIGKLTNEQLDRLILDKLHHTRQEVICAPSVGVDCTALRLDDGVAVLSCDPITAAEKGIGRLTVNVCCNDAAASGAEPIGLMVTLLLPPSITESEINSLMDELTDAAAKANIDVIGGHTEITESVNRIVTCATVIAKPTKAGLITPKGMREGNDIVMTKHAGIEGALLLAYMLEPANAVLTNDELNTAMSFYECTSVVREGLYAALHGATAMHDVTEGGIFGAMWEMSAASGVGIIFDIDSIPIHNVTKKLCDHFAIDPYKLISSGSMLIACNNGAEMVDGLASVGIDASVIGQAKGGKVISTNGVIVSPPEADELYKAT